MNELGNLEIPWVFIIGYVAGVLGEKLRAWAYSKDGDSK